MYLKPAYHKLFSWMGWSIASFRDVSHETWTVAPSETQRVEPAIFRPEDLARITRSWDGPSLQYEMNYLTADSRHHAATIAYRLRDVDVADGHLYSGRWKDKLIPKRARLMRPKLKKRESQGTLACTFSGNHYFGHWLTDDLTLHLAAEQIGSPFIFDRKPFLHEPGYRELLNVKSRVIEDASFDELIILQDFGQNEFKRRRYDTLRARLREGRQFPAGRRVMLRRGTSGVSRAVVNADELESCLSAAGFNIVDPEHLTPAEIVEQTLGAEVVIGVEGSQIPHALLSMADGGVLCCVQPPNRFNNTIKGYTDCLGMRYSILVGYPAPGGFRVEIDDVKWMLDKVETVLHKVAVR